MSEEKKILTFETVNGMRVVSFILEDNEKSVLLQDPFVFRVSQNPKNPEQPMFTFTPVTMFAKTQEVWLQKHNVIFTYEPGAQIVGAYKAMVQQDKANRAGIIQPKKHGIIMP